MVNGGGGEKGEDHLGPPKRSLKYRKQPIAAAEKGECPESCRVVAASWHNRILKFEVDFVN
jgi:hypothetical protein